MNIGRIPPEGGGGGDIPLGAEKRRWHHDRASLMFSGYGVPPVRRSPRCAWGWSVAWDAGLPQDALVATQRRNGRAFSSLTARGGGLPVGVTATLARKRKARDIDLLSFEQKVQELEEDWVRFIQIQLTTETMDFAKDLARDIALRGADAVHLASA